MAVQQNKNPAPPVTCAVRTTLSRLAPCPWKKTTGEVHLRHHVSPEGVYRGRKVIDKGADE